MFRTVSAHEDGTALASPVTERAGRNAAAMAVAEVLGKLGTFAYTLLAARELGKGDFGAFAYAVSFSLLVTSVPVWGFDPVVVQEGSRDRSRLPKLVTELLVWRAGLGLPVFAALGFVAAQDRPTTRATVALALALLAGLCDVYSESNRSAAAALRDQLGVARALALQRLATAVLAVGALFAGLGLVGVAGAYALGALGGALVSSREVRRLGLRLTPRDLTWEGLGQMGRRSVVFGVGSLVGVVLFRIDAVLLATLKDDAAVGAYAAAYRLLETVLFVSWAVGKALFPVMAADPQPGPVRSALGKGLGALGAVYVPFAVGLAVMAGPVVRLLYGGEYGADTVAVTRWLAPAPLIFAVSYLANYALVAMGKARQAVVVGTLVAVLNVVANLLLIPVFGVVGSAITTTASYAVEAAVILVLTGSVLGGRVKLARALGPALLAAAVMAGVIALPGIRQTVLVAVPVACAVYAISWLAITKRLAPDQLQLLASLRREPA